MKTALRLLLAPYRFSVDRLFRMGEVGWAHWFDSPSLYPGGNHLYLYQDNAGTTPVTAVGDTIGLSLDRAYGGRTDGSLIGSGATGLTGTATAASYNTSTGAGSVSRAGDASNQSWVTWTGLTTSAIHRIRVTNTGATSLDVRNGGVAGTIVASIAAGATSYVHPLTSGGSTSITITATNNSTTATFTVLEFGRVPGTHLIQATGTARPTLSARVNGLTYTEQFDNAYWTKNAQATVTANQAVAPDGNTTADSWVAASGGNNAIQVGVTSVNGSTPTAAMRESVALKYVSGSVWVQLIWSDGGANQCRAWFNVQTGVVGTSSAGGTATVTATPTVTPLGNGWYRLTIQGTQPGATGYFVVVCRDADNSTTQASGSFYIWGADLRTADDAAKNIPVYQRVGATAADHDTDGFPHCALFDGTDDSWASTATVDGSATDKVTVVAGVTKNSDATQGVVFDHGTSPANAAEWGFSAPGAGGTTTFTVGGRSSAGSAGNSGENPTGFTAPLSSSVAASIDWSAVAGAEVSMWVNGARATGYFNGTQENTGVFGNKTLYVGSRAGASLRLNGRLYSFVFRFGAMGEADRNRLEQWTKNLMRLP